MTKPITSTQKSSLKVRRLGANDVADYRELRLECLKAHPEAFSSSFEDEAAQPASWWERRLATNATFGGWVDTSPLVGVASFILRDRIKLAHKGVLSGMYVRPQARGTGLAAALVHGVIEHARTTRVEDICLKVVASNAAAYCLYSGAGFQEYGLELNALKVEDKYYDEMLMTLSLKPQNPRD
jgi:GNAT superfamily N-acetyltransferase